ncbi:6202_t:CDS:2 [Dentiscutata erythropus]|uniref:6202_t:CDS:1 n=1 Tax=Dentiscutata erythropus TaxID=1348616 RepID=A0A9N8Z401_9GLOM|nr:6202_t:CDS:2 [Dentiscutata erythropus]
MQYETGEDINKNKLNLKQAIDYISDAWGAIDDEVVINCWKKTGILPAVENEEIIGASEFQDEENLLENDDLDTLLDEFSREDDYSATLTSAMVDFFNNIDQTIATEEALMDQQIVNLVQNENNIVENDQDDSDEEPSEISTQEAYNALKTWLSFFEQQESSDFDMKDIKIFKKYSKIINRILSDSKKQS